MEVTTSNKGSSWRNKGAISFEGLYKHYKKTCDNPLSRQKWREVIELANKEFMRLIIEEGKSMRMPYLSTLSVIKYQAVRPHAFDYNHYNLTGEKKLLKNEHSDGYQARFRWNKYKCRIPGMTAYTFEPARPNSRGIAKEMNKFNGHGKYTEHYGHKKRQLKNRIKPSNI